MKDPRNHHRPRSVALAIRVDRINSHVNRRFIRASRAYGRASGARPLWLSRQLFAKVRHYADDSDRRQAALLALAPRNLSDEALRAAHLDALEDLWAMSESVAEDMNEAALYGDGPVGSMARRHAMGSYERVEEALRAEMLARGFFRAPAPVPALDNADDEIPF